MCIVVLLANEVNHGSINLTRIKGGDAHLARNVVDRP